MRKLTALFVASTLALGATSMAFAADTATTTAAPTEGKMMMHHKGKPGMHHEMMMFKDLNLTDAQKQQIRDIMKSQRDQMKRPPLEERRAMHDIIASDSFDKAKAEAQIDKMAEQHKARMLAHMETQNKIYNILTPEQKKQFNAVKCRSVSGVMVRVRRVRFAVFLPRRGIFSGGPVLPPSPVTANFPRSRASTG